MFVNIHGNSSMLEHSWIFYNIGEQCPTMLDGRPHRSIFVGQLVSTKIHECCSINVASSNRDFKEWRVWDGRSTDADACQRVDVSLNSSATSLSSLCWGKWKIFTIGLTPSYPKFGTISTGVFAYDYSCLTALSNSRIFTDQIILSLISDFSYNRKKLALVFTVGTRKIVLYIRVILGPLCDVWLTESSAFSLVVCHISCFDHCCPRVHSTTRWMHLLSILLT